MVCGLPVIVSDQVGAGYDLVRHGENGFVFPVGEVEILAKHIEELATNKELCARLGAQARRTMESHSYAQCVSSFVQALSSLHR
jgi:glycosyltransferase involved in cell wall biosynthesis